MTLLKTKVRGTGSPALLSAFFGVVAAAVLGIFFYLILAQRAPGAVESGGAQESVLLLAEAVTKGDADTAMTYIDFDALFEDVYRRHLAVQYNVDAADPAVTEMYQKVPPHLFALAENDLKKMIAAEEVVIGDNDVLREDPAAGTLPDMLKRILDGRVRMTGADSALVEFSDRKQYFILARSADDGKWRITGFSGFEDVVEGARAEIEKSVQDYIISDINAQAGAPKAGAEVK